MADKRNSLFDAFSTENARQVAVEHEALNFQKKPHNILGLFYLVVVIISMTGIWLTAVDIELNGVNVTWAYMIVGLSVCAFLVIFIFLNHRWAMIAACLIYVSDRVLFLVNGGYSVGKIIFGLMCIALTWHALLVATALTKKKKVDVSAFD